MGIDDIRQLLADWRDDAWYNKAYGLFLMKSGARKELGRHISDMGNLYRADPDLGDYPDIMPALTRNGLHNHDLIDSRIVLQSMIGSEPQVFFGLDDPIKKEANQVWVTTRWNQGRWKDEFDRVGMELRACGMGLVELGFVQGRLTVQFRSVLDTLRDRLYTSPSQWRGVAFRNRLDPRDVATKYGKALAQAIADGRLSASSVKELIDDKTEALIREDQSGGTTLGNRPSQNVVKEWSFYSDEKHVIFLGGIANGITLGYNPETIAQTGELQYEVMDEPGWNPFGLIPCGVWVDSWAPGVGDPVGNAESGSKISNMLNAAEFYLDEAMRRGIALNFLSTMGLDPDLVTKIATVDDLTDLGKIIPVDLTPSEMQGILQRTQAAPVPGSVLELIELFREYKNANSGVMDSQRGVVQGGERTKFEMQQVASGQGVQVQHLRRQYATFLEEIIRKGRFMASQWEDVDEVLHFSDGPLPTAFFPLSPILGEPCEIRVAEESLVAQTEDQRRSQRMFEFEHVDIPAMKAGVADPYKVFYSLYRDLGEKDPLSRMKDPAQYAQFQQAQMVAQQMQQVGASETSEPVARLE